MNGEQDTRSGQERSGKDRRPSAGEVSHREAPQGHREEGSRSTVESSVTLTPVESSHLAGYDYDPQTETLELQFRNGDRWSYAYVHQDLFDHFVSADSMGSFFTSRIKPACPGTLISKGTLAERAEIWLRSKEALQYAGSAVALQMGNPVSVCAWMELEKIADLRSLYDGDKSVVIVEVPNAVKTRVE